MSFVLALDDQQAQKIMIFYRDYQQDNPNEHVRFFAQTTVVTITLYHSGKLVFQGDDAKAEYDMWVQILQITDTQPQPQPKKPLRASYNDYYYSSIGSDEVGKGDVFGPIVVCAAFLPKNKMDYIKGLGIKDSKQLSDERIRYIGRELINSIPYSVLTLHNEKYNELVRSGFNINKMMAYLHNRAILNVLKKINGSPEVITDQFVPEHLYYRYLHDERNVYKNVTFLTKAESHYASVAIASIIARYAFLRQFDELSKESGFTLLKGAGKQVDEVLADIIEQKGEGFLSSYAKMNYKNIERAREMAKSSD
ncbi:ribonuclease HIII [Candidatus Xianfuyuplasma coldseepsis]|uniref:Ribonuclease HIII n=1 Tax=Candidatus Xianfuyuplasma coldseepsis TaxID=2782163 RepID=A0A7L7KVU0_9MOLU|nr:ribonuclease HIII [Xianfuyuplasma coldseepsis]QMS85868.1 ribonuclease HIII [Xianfuyuplasma coldseepsis]